MNPPLRGHRTPQGAINGKRVRNRTARLPPNSSFPFICFSGWALGASCHHPFSNVHFPCLSSWHASPRPELSGAHGSFLMMWAASCVPLTCGHRCSRQHGCELILPCPVLPAALKRSALAILHCGHTWRWSPHTAAASGLNSFLQTISLPVCL